MGDIWGVSLGHSQLIYSNGLLYIQRGGKKKVK